jgi:hypothetical protein
LRANPLQLLVGPPVDVHPAQHREFG